MSIPRSNDCAGSEKIIRSRHPRRTGATDSPGTMKRILFVDDEPQLLEGLRDGLRSRRREWSMDFAVGGEAALEKLAEHAYDVVVSDMRMPGLDGLAVLARVQA